MEEGGSTTEDKRLALIDADFFLYYCTHNKKDDSGEIQEKTFEEVCEEADVFLAKILTAVNTDEYIAAFTAGKSFRYSVYPDYKGNRKGFEKPKFFQELKEWLLKNKGFTFEMNLEADDYVSILKRDPSFYSEKEDQKILVSNDKDVLMLQGMHYNPVKGHFIITFDGDSEQYFWKSMITGDTADNIKGIPGKGVKFADKLLDHLEINQYPSDVLRAYVDHFGVHEGTEEFYKNYKCLKILDKGDFKRPEIQIYS